MPREAKPYAERGWYVSRPFGRYVRLCRVDEGMTEAKRLLKLKLGELEVEREQLGGRLSTRMTVTELFTLFLEDVEATKDEDTFRDYQRWCTEFARAHGNKPARSITKAHANDFKLALMKATYVVGKQPPRPYKPKTVNHALITLRRAFNWAIETERLPAGRNPFAGVGLLHCEGRKRVATEAEFQSLLEHCTDDAFRDVLTVLRYTSARPQDLYSLTWSMVDWDARMWVLAEHKGSRTAREPKPRIIGMNDEVERVLRRRREQFGGAGHVFLNADGRPWTKDALGLRMRRLRERAGIKPDEQGEQFVLYTNRHTFLTKAGADPAISQSTLAEIAGHTDPRTTARYVHAARLAVAADGRRVADSLNSPAPASGG
jgi:integrase